VKITSREEYLRKNSIYPPYNLRSDLSEFKGEKLFFFSEPSMVLAGVTISKKDNKRKNCQQCYCSKNGTCDIEKEYKFIESFLNKEHLVLILDVRGVGGVKVKKITLLVLNYIVYHLCQPVAGGKCFFSMEPEKS